MKKKIYILVSALIFGGLFLIGCNKKKVQPEIIPTNEIVETTDIVVEGN